MVAFGRSEYSPRIHFVINNFRRYTDSYDMTGRLETQLNHLNLKSYYLVSDKGRAIFYMNFSPCNFVTEDKRKGVLSLYKVSLGDLLEFTGSDDFTEKV